MKSKCLLPISQTADLSPGRFYNKKAFVEEDIYTPICRMYAWILESASSLIVNKRRTLATTQHFVNMNHYILHRRSNRGQNTSHMCVHVKWGNTCLYKFHGFLGFIIKWIEYQLCFDSMCLMLECLMLKLLYI